jgi:hypothetical protein
MDRAQPGYDDGLMRSVLRCSAIVFFTMSCGGEPAPVAHAPPPAAAPPLAPAVPARWAFAAPPDKIVDTLDLGDAGVLAVGDHGRRQLYHGTSRTDASVPFPHTLAAILRDDAGRVAFVTEDGGVDVASDALGPLVTLRKGPLGELPPWIRVTSIARGRAAILITASDGRVLRTTDFGATWTAVDYAGSPRPYGTVASVALDRRGHGVLLHVPQRVFVTQDDGATWTPAPSPPMGAYAALHDADDHVFVRGFHDAAARLDGDRLVPTPDAPKPFVVPPAPPPPPPSSPDDAVHVLAGDHVVELVATRHRGQPSTIAVRSTRLGEPPGDGVTVPALSTTRSLRGRLAAYGADLMFLRTDAATDDHTPPTATLVLSSDHGTTWTSGPTLRFGDTQEYDPVVALGPHGWAYVPSVCGTPAGASQRVCLPPQVRAAGSTSFEDVRAPGFLAHSFTFDEAHDRVYAIAEAAPDDDADAGDDDTGPPRTKPIIYQSPLSKVDFTPTGLSADSSGWTAPTLSVDPSGTLHVWRYEPDKNTYAVERRDRSGQALPKAYLPLRTLSKAGSVATPIFAGLRGALFMGDAFSWETADGGETWARVPGPGPWFNGAACSEAGCAGGPLQRIGWDLPARVVGDEDRASLLASLPDVPKTEPPRGTDVKPAPPPPLSLSCRGSGPGAKLVQRNYEVEDRAGSATRWSQVESGDDGRLTLILGDRDVVRRVTVLGPLPVKPATKPVAKPRSPGTPPPTPPPLPPPPPWGHASSEDGWIAARASGAKPGKPAEVASLVDVELAWYSLATGRVVHVSLPGLDGLEIPENRWSGGHELPAARIVPGGLLFQPTRRSPALFVHDDGKVERWTLPANVSVNAAYALGRSWVLLDMDRGGTQFTWSDDGGRSWQQRAWTLMPPNVSTSADLLVVGGRASVGVWDGTREASVAITLPLPPEPPTPVLLDFPAPVDEPCDPKAKWSRNLDVSTDQDTVRATVTLQAPAETVQLVARRRASHQLESGGYCTNGYDFVEDGKFKHQAVLFRDGNGWSGWSFRPDDKAHSGYVAEPVRCVVER